MGELILGLILFTAVIAVYGTFDMLKQISKIKDNE
jgi:hypothetical protein